MMKNDLFTTSKAIETVCHFNLRQAQNGYGIDTTESLNQIIEEFCEIFSSFPEMDTDEAIEFWDLNQDGHGNFKMP